jgi:hypothetical protein
VARRLAALLVVTIATAAIALRAGGSGDAPALREASPPPPSAEDVVNVWVDPDGGTCRRGPAPARYDSAAACGSLQQAHEAALPGDVVVLTCPGTLCDYGSEPQALEDDKGSVTFRPASGKEIVTGDVRFQPAGSITLEGEGRWTLDDDFYAYPGAADITVRGVKAAKFYIRCAFRVTVEESVFTDRVATGVPTISSSFGQPVPDEAARVCGPGAPARDITLRSNDFHEIWKPVGCSNTECHTECLHVQGVDGLRIEGNRFHDCLANTASISFNVHDHSTIRGVEVVGNSFARSYEDVDDADCPGPGDCPQRSGIGDKLSIHFSTTSADGCEAVIRSNTFASGGRHISAECPERGAGIVVEENRFDVAPGCEAQAPTYTWRGNVARAGVWEPECDDGGNRIEAG